jgi:hypothetical protein
MQTIEIITRIAIPLVVTGLVAAAWPTLRNWKA